MPPASFTSATARSAAFLLDWPICEISPVIGADRPILITFLEDELLPEEQPARGSAIASAITKEMDLIADFFILISPSHI
ncbi:hypothetical protein SDC9_54893 [bioreactor metagenome]|uniref:Uncharacterized protein n=1 Tax=bioreactor metagenome TaxID=1076179 RepID=A0A644WXE7_9ZZZZ